jgi:sugar phosphate isomerase/epimerase/protein-tyrosine-phosphatase
MKQPHVLFVCTGNAGRSQMAEALFRRQVGDRVRVSSGGVDPWDRLHPVAVRLLHERGIDVADQYPKHVETLRGQTFDVVVTLGDPACKKTPELRGNPRRLRWAIPDPADADNSGPVAQTAAFRTAMTAIEDRLEDLTTLVCDGVHAGDLNLAPGISTMGVIPNFERPVFDPARHMPLLAAAGFESLELGCYLGRAHFPWDQPDRIKELARIVADAGVRITSVHAEGNGIGVPDARQRRQMLDVTRAFADVAAQLGASVVVVHGGLPRGMDRTAGEDILHETLVEMEQHVLSMPCMFGWENEAPGLTAETHLQWIRKFNPGALGLVLDVGHAHIQQDLDAYLNVAGLRLVGLHLDDNHGKEDEHRLPGQGTVSWPECVRGIVRTGYIGPLTVESFDFKRANDLPAFLRDAKSAADRLRIYAEGKETPGATT